MIINKHWLNHQHPERDKMKEIKNHSFLFVVVVAVEFFLFLFLFLFFFYFKDWR